MEIYAEITKKILGLVEGGNFKLDLPSGVDLKRKSGSRACYFECQDESSKEELIDLLENRGISWQENGGIVDKGAVDKNEKPSYRNSRYIS